MWKTARFRERSPFNGLSRSILWEGFSTSSFDDDEAAKRPI